jgi:hypothetical protein
MSESFNFEYCRCCTCGYEWRKGLNGSHSCAENLQRQLAEAERRIDVMDCYICDEDRPRIERELK